MGGPVRSNVLVDSSNCMCNISGETISILHICLGTVAMFTSDSEHNYIGRLMDCTSGALPFTVCLKMICNKFLVVKVNC